MQNTRFKSIKTLVLIGMLAATITGGKLAIPIPNVEIVTLLIMLYTAVFGLRIALPVVIVFVSVEMLIFGINTWVISYYIYWCLLSIVTFLLGRKGKILIYPIIAVVMSAFFGALTSFVDTLFAAGLASYGFFKVFTLVYLRGVNFYLTHIISNAVIVLFAFAPLKKLLTRLKISYFGNNLVS
ncbi:MAG: hypothetical protein WC292_03455 [Clostridia bacterium]